MKTPFKHTPLHTWHHKHEASFVNVAGWECVVNYGNVEHEARTIKDSVGMRDVTPLAKCLIEGQDSSDHIQNAFALTQLQGVGTCSVATLRNVAVRLSILRITADRYLVTASSDCQKILYDALAGNLEPGDCVHVTDMTSAYAAFHLIGPKSIEVLKRCASAPLEVMRSRQCLQSPTARVWSLLVRDDVGTLPAWLILVSRDFGEYVWTSILAEGRDFGIGVFGQTAAQLLSAGVFDVAAV